jgi:chemotaxis protein MotA
VENDVEKPEASAILKNYPEFLNDRAARDFVCDTLRMAITGGVEPFDMDQMMELDMEVHHHDATEPVGALSSTADALPGLGIVAAAGGGDHDGRAGWPIGGDWPQGGGGAGWNVSGNPAVIWSGRSAECEHGQVRGGALRLSTCAAGAAGGVPERGGSIIAVEMARRAIPAHLRPSFNEMEKSCKGRPSEAAAAPAAA